MLKIQELRKEKGLSQRELAEKIASTNKNIWAYENGIATPPIETLIKLADFFGCSLDYLCGREDDFGNATERETYNTVEEDALLHNFRTLNKHDKTQITDFINFLAQKKTR